MKKVETLIVKVMKQQAYKGEGEDVLRVIAKGDPSTLP